MLVLNYKKGVDTMPEYYVSYNDYFGYCVIQKFEGTAEIIYAGSIEDCNRVCVEMNQSK